MNKLAEAKTEKVLLIRMLSSADVCAIGLPVLRYFQKNNPQAEIHFLTFGDGAELIKLAEPSVLVCALVLRPEISIHYVCVARFVLTSEEHAMHHRTHTLMSYVSAFTSTPKSGERKRTALAISFRNIYSFAGDPRLHSSKKERGDTTGNTGPVIFFSCETKSPRRRSPHQGLQR